ncbi:hypothetical protein DPMN_028262 [Dreissena polymorpha]|uniref:Uncharacterized protein n=1 Tax=Dreissena polymorpha TaxID=45954 RepID=A0A9D4LV57_DREPO|nr:hypothetical protein DPMN_028262 [Dreissena polymorpha]
MTVTITVKMTLTMEPYVALRSMSDGDNDYDNDCDHDCYNYTSIKHTLTMTLTMTVTTVPVRRTNIFLTEAARRNESMPLCGGNENTNNKQRNTRFGRPADNPKRHKHNPRLRHGQIISPRRPNRVFTRRIAVALSIDPRNDAESTVTMVPMVAMVPTSTMVPTMCQYIDSDNDGDTGTNNDGDTGTSAKHLVRSVLTETMTVTLTETMTVTLTETMGDTCSNTYNNDAQKIDPDVVVEVVVVV